MRKDNKGVTIIELLVVIAIMGVLIGVFGYSLSMISHRRVTNNASSIKQTIQLAQTYNKSKGNTAELGNAAVEQAQMNRDDEDEVAEANKKREQGLCKVRIMGPAAGDSTPYLYLYVAGSQNELDNPNLKPSEKIRLEKKTTIKITYDNDKVIIIGKNNWADIRLSRTTGGFMEANYSGVEESSGTQESGSSTPVKIVVTDNERTVTLNLATYTGVITRGGKNEKPKEE